MSLYNLLRKEVKESVLTRNKDKNDVQLMITMGLTWPVGCTYIIEPKGAGILLQI